MNNNNINNYNIGNYSDLHKNLNIISNKTNLNKKSNMNLIKLRN